MNKAEIGKAGEEFAAAYFEKRGYILKERNYRSRGGEIDLIAENEKYLVFVEVKTRSDEKHTRAGEAVDENKRRRLILTAMKYLSDISSEKQARFDVFEAYHTNGRIYKFNHIENAFTLTDFGEDYGVF